MKAAPSITDVEPGPASAKAYDATYVIGGRMAVDGHQRSVDDPGEIVDNLRGLAWLREVANALPPSANLSSEVAMPLPLVNGRNRRARIGLITTSHPSP